MTHYSVSELAGKGDPMFGGSADDRPLGKSGLFLRGSYALFQVATFPTESMARDAAVAATNRRPGALLSVAPASKCGFFVREGSSLRCTLPSGHDYACKHE